MRDRLQSGIGSDPLQLTYVTAVLKAEVRALHTSAGSAEDLGFMWRGLRDAHEKGTGEHVTGTAL